MITSRLNRNGLTRSLLFTTIRTHSTVNRCGHPTAYSAFVLVSNPASSSSIFLPTRCSNVRRVSTFPESTRKNGTGHVEPATPTPPRKSKVELRPGPIKPQKSSTPTAAATHAEASSPKSDALTSTSSISSASPSNTSIVETTKYDYEVASQHGILAPPPKDSSWAYGLYHQAKELFKFYWRGVKLINTNRRRVREMRERAKNTGVPLSRWETRFIRTYKQDIVKLVPFAIIFIVLEEIIPLIVLYAPFLLPSTCVLPSQKERIDNKRREKQQNYASAMVDDFREVYQRAIADQSLSADALLCSGPTVPLSMTGVLGLSTFGPKPMRIRRVKHHLSLITQDDALLLREDAILSLSEPELRDALEERGLLSDSHSMEQLQSRLRWWLNQVKVSSADADPVRDRIVLVARGVAGKF